MAGGRIRFLTCSNCDITVRDLGTLNPSCYKCHAPLQAKNQNGRTDSGRSGQLGWSSRSSSSHEQLEDSADGRTSDVESRTGGLGWRNGSSREQTEHRADGRTSDVESRSGSLGWRSGSSREHTELRADGRPVVGGVGVRDASNLSQFESTVNRLAVRVEGSLNMRGTSDSEASRTRHGPRQSLFSSCPSVVSSEDTFDGDDTSSWNGDYPGSPHSAAYEPSISSEDGYLSRGVSRRTRKSRGLARASNPVGESSFGSLDVVTDAASREVPQGRFGPPRPRGERFLSDTSGSLGLEGSSGNRSQVLEAFSSSSGSRELSGFDWAGEGIGDPLGHASSSSGELGRPGGSRRNQYSTSNQQPPTRPRHLEAGGRTSLDGLREVNPYGHSSSSRSQASPVSTRLPPPPSHYQPSPPASRSSHCCAHCRSEACRAFEQFGVDVCCANGDCSTCSHTCCQPLSISASGSQQCHGKPNPFIPKPSSAPEHHDGQAPLKTNEKKKRYARPVFGGANFIRCYECDELLQMPEDVHFSRTRRNKLRCGSCSEIIVYCLIDKTHIVPYKDAVNQKIMSSTARVDGGGNRVSKSHAAASSKGDGSNHSQSDQISYNDNYSAYSDGAGSTEGEPDSLPKTALRKRQAAALHRLMGYFSARDIMYQAPT